MFFKKNVLHNCLTVSVAVLGMLGAGALVNTSTHASTNTKPVVVRSAKVQNKSQKPVAHKNSLSHYRAQVFAAGNNYNIYQNNWSKVGVTSNRANFHHIFNVRGAQVHDNRTYYNLYKGKRYVGYTNKNSVVNTNKTVYLKVPYISQYRPVFAPWGCSEAAISMLLDSKAGGNRHVNLPYVFRHTPKYPMKGGQIGNVYTGAGFRHVVTPAALTRYAHHWNKHVKNISGTSTNGIKMWVQSGHPVLFYGYSSYQKPYDHNRNHCKVITAYRHGYFRIFDPLYFNAHQSSGTGGHNMMFDHGAISWLSLRRFNYEYAVVRGSNRKSALTV